MSAQVPGILAQPSDGYRYHAFISYRHVEPDRKWAKWLHSTLETYRVPRKLVKERHVPERIGRVFRDEEELPASAELKSEIDTALRESRFLIVVCSPRVVSSQWCNKEVERFRELGRHDRILALLIEGEPHESFPRALREIRRPLVDAQGMTSEQIEEVEPLAADVRPSRKEAQGHLGRMAKLRLLACLLGVRFDDLRQREHERRARRLTYLGAGVAVLALAMGALAAVAISQRNEARSQRAVAVAQTALAQKREGEANTQRGIAEVQTREALKQKRLSDLRAAEAIVGQGDGAAAEGYFADARADYGEALDAFTAVQASPLLADIAWSDYFDHYGPPPLWTYAIKGGSQEPVAVSPADARIALAGSRLVNLVTGQVLGNPSQSYIGAVDFSADGKTALAVGDNTVVLNGGRTYVLRKGGGRTDADPDSTGTPYDGCLSRDGSLVLLGHDNKVMTLRESHTGRRVQTFTGHEGQVTTVALSTDNRYALSGCTGASKTVLRTEPLRLWDVKTAQVLQTWKDFSGSYHGADLSPDGTMVAYGTDESGHYTGDAAVKLCDAASGREIRSIPSPGAGDRVQCVAFSGDTTRVMWVNYTGIVRVADVKTGRVIRTFAWGPTSAYAFRAAFTPGGHAALVGASQVILYDLGPSLERRTFAGHDWFVPAVGFSADGRLAVSGSWDGTVRIWDVAGGHELRRYAEGPKHEMHGAAVSPDGRMALALCGGQRTVTLFDVVAGKKIQTLASAEDQLPDVSHAAFSPDGRRAVCQTGQQTRVWEVPSGKLLQTLDGAPLAFSSDGRQAVTGGKSVTLWDASFNKLRSFPLPQGRLASEVVFAPDSHSVLVGGSALQMLDLGNGDLRSFDLHGTTDDTTGPLAFSPDGQFAISCHGTIKLWDVTSGRLLRTLNVHNGEAEAAVFSPDGRAMLSGGQDGAVELCDFSRPANYRNFEPRLAAMKQALAKNPNDATALATLGEWYNFRGVWLWAAGVLEAARSGGAPVRPAMLGHCYWQLKQFDDAAREFAAALAGAGDEREKLYLNLCLQAVKAESERPASQPATIPSP